MKPVKQGSHKVTNHQDDLRMHHKRESLDSLAHTLRIRTRSFKVFHCRQGQAAQTLPPEGRVKMARRGSHEKAMASDRRGERRAGHGRAAAGKIGPRGRMTTDASERNRRDLEHLEGMEQIYPRPGHHLRPLSKRSNPWSGRRRRLRNCLVKNPCSMRRAHLERRYLSTCNTRRERPWARVSRPARCRVRNTDTSAHRRTKRR